MVGGRIVYVSTPDYMATFAQRMAAGGVRILGGCCGTTPSHIRALAEALRQPIETAPAVEVPGRPWGSNGSQPASAGTVVATPPARVAEAEAPVPRGAGAGVLEEVEERVSVHDELGSFAWKLGREFVVSIELAPPLGVNPAKLLAGAHMLKEKGVDAVNVTDSALG